MMAAKIRCVTAEDRRSVTVNRALARSVLPLVLGLLPTLRRAPHLSNPVTQTQSHALVLWIGLNFVLSIPLWVDYLWQLWDPRNQTLHDKVAKTVVIKLGTIGPTTMAGWYQSPTELGVWEYWDGSSWTARRSS